MAESDTIKVDTDTHLMLEQPLLRLPHELLKRNLKSAQRHIESTNKSITTSLQPNKSAAEALAALDATLAKAQNLKRKLEALHNEERAIQSSQRARVQHLQELHDIREFTEVRYDKWSQTRLDRLLVDYLLRQGYIESAKGLAKERNVGSLVDVSIFEECKRVETALRQGELKEALAWCNENKGVLKKLDSDIEQDLRLQQFIELKRQGGAGKCDELLAFARKHFAGEQYKTYSRLSAGLVVIPEGTEMEPYSSLYSHDRYKELAIRLVDVMQKVLALPSTPLLHVALSAGLSALKTPSCHSAHALANTANTGASVCPICSTELNELARNVPYAHQTKSSIEDDPVMLPNGRVFGRERLKSLNEKLGTRAGYVKDPTQSDNGMEWEVATIKKVFIS